MHFLFLICNSLEMREYMQTCSTRKAFVKILHTFWATAFDFSDNIENESFGTVSFNVFTSTSLKVYICFVHATLIKFKIVKFRVLTFFYSAIHTSKCTYYVNSLERMKIETWYIYPCVFRFLWMQALKS